MMPLGAPSISKYGSLVRLDTQIVALRAHCAHTARVLRLRRPHRALSLSLSFWTTLNRVFGCTVCWEGSPLGPHANVSAAPTADLKPFMVPNPAEPQTYRVYPRLTQDRHGRFPYGCWDCTTVIDFLQSPLSPLSCGMAKDAIILAPTVSTAGCLLETRRAQGTALMIAFDVRFHKMFTHWPHQNFCDESLGQWWWVTASPEVVSCRRVHSHDFVKLFGGMMHQHDASIHLPPSPIVSVSVYPHSFSEYFRYVIATETQIRAQGLRAKWNFKTRRLNTRFDWTAIPRSWDTVNKSIQWPNCKLGRLIHMWRMTDQSVSESGLWIYALWIPGYNKVYVGQTGARGVYRSVFDRGKEHIIQARDWALMHQGKRAAVPLHHYAAHAIRMSQYQNCHRKQQAQKHRHYYSATFPRALRKYHCLQEVPQSLLDVTIFSEKLFSHYGLLYFL